MEQPTVSPAQRRGSEVRARRPRSWTRRAWWTLALTPVGVVVGIVVGDGIAWALGYGDGDGTVPWWVAAIAGTAGTACIVAAPVVAALCARRGSRRGEGREARTAFWVCSGIAALVLVQTVLAILFS